MVRISDSVKPWGFVAVDEFGKIGMKKVYGEECYCVARDNSEEPLPGVGVCEVQGVFADVRSPDPFATVFSSSFSQAHSLQECRVYPALDAVKKRGIPRIWLKSSQLGELGPLNRRRLARIWDVSSGLGLARVNRVG